MKTYTITSGSFRRDDGSIANTGDTIDLEDDVAALHAGRVHPVQSEPPAADGAVDEQH